MEGNMDIRTELALIPDPRIDRCKKHTLVDILLFRSIAMVCGVVKAIRIVSAWADQTGLVPGQVQTEVYEEARELFADSGEPGCSFRTVKGVVATELRYYLTTLTDAGEFARSVRSHWGIENKVHRVPDVAFREDYARNRKDHSAANLAIVRKITRNLLRLEPAEQYGKRKLSLNRKRLYASYEPDFLLKILCNL
jgi:predicted transposase YbfD/YdcC